jgi:hypothetical protein
MSGPARPTLYNPEYADCARELCARRVTTPDLVGRFGVGPSPIGQWSARHCQFAETMQQGRDVADATAIESLFTCITGDNHQAEKVFRYRGEPKAATDAKMSGGNAGIAGNLQFLGNSGLLGPAAKRRKSAEIGGNPLRILWSGIRRPFCCLTQGVQSKLSIPTSLAHIAETPRSGRQRHRASAAAIVPP